MCTVVILTIILCLSHTTSSEVITCDATDSIFCGPCQKPGICNLQCLGHDEVCLDTQLSCKEGSECQVDCAAPNACSDATINAPHASSLTVNCHDLTSCDSTTLNVANNADIILNCEGKDGSCKDIVLNGQFAGNVEVNCIGLKSCYGMQIQCGNGDCNINCIEESGVVCSRLTLLCGYGQCSIDCTSVSGIKKCDLFTLNSIDTTKAQKFECIGSATDCFNAPQSFAHPTVSPTVIPTKLPTLTPIFIPTNIPTLRPTPDPTTKPSIPTPSTKPTVSPSMKPTVQGQTRTPTPSPTISPSNKPTLSPVTTSTAQPTKAGNTVSPTLSPTSSPTKVITINPTETVITTPSPTYNQLDAAHCCHCLIPSKKTDPVKGCAVDPECQQIICDFDEFCCIDRWDKTCVFYASEHCEKTTPIHTNHSEVLRTTDYNAVMNEGRDLESVWIFAVTIIFVSYCAFCVIMQIKKWGNKWYVGQIKNKTEDGIQMDGDDMIDDRESESEERGERANKIKRSSRRKRKRQRMKSHESDRSDDVYSDEEMVEFMKRIKTSVGKRHSV